MKLIFDTTQDVQIVIDNLDNSYISDAIIKTTSILCSSYICAKRHYYRKLTKEQIAIVEQNLYELSNGLGIKLVGNYNNKLYMWARSCEKNFSWVFKLWVGLNYKYYCIKNVEHKCFKFSGFLLKESTR